MLWTCCCIFCTCLILEFYGIPSNQGFLSLASALQLKDVQDIEGSPQLDSLFLNRPCTLCVTNWIIKYFLLHFYSWWSKRRELKKEFKPSDSKVKHVRILLVGPVGSRKSSFINSVNTVFQGYKNWTSKFSNTGSRCVSMFLVFSTKPTTYGLSWWVWKNIAQNRCKLMTSLVYCRGVQRKLIHIQF